MENFYGASSSAGRPRSAANLTKHGVETNNNNNNNNRMKTAVAHNRPPTSAAAVNKSAMHHNHHHHHNRHQQNQRDDVSSYCASSFDGTNNNGKVEVDFFDFTIENAEGLPFELNRWRGRVVIVTNIGTFASNAKAELEALNSIAHCYGENVAIIGVPCNHFYHEPSADTSETLAIWEHVRPGKGFRPDPNAFYLTTHAAVNGADQLPMFRFLKKALPLPADDQFSFNNSDDNKPVPFCITWSPMERCDVTSDFEKFVIRPDGKPVRRYTGHYQAVNLFHDVARLVEEFSLTADSARLSSMRFLRPTTVPINNNNNNECALHNKTNDDNHNNNNVKVNGKNLHSQQQQPAQRYSATLMSSTSSSATFL